MRPRAPSLSRTYYSNNYEIFGIDDKKNCKIIHFDYKKSSKEYYMLFNIVDITDIACKMIINSSDNDIIIYTVIDVTNLLTLNPIL